MAGNDAVEMFGTPILAVTPDGAALQNSLNACAAKADDINANLGRGVVVPGIDQIASSASDLVRVLGSGRSADDMRSKVQDLNDSVTQNTQALGNRVDEAISTVSDLVAKFEQAATSWANVHDVPTLKKAIGDTAQAGESLGKALVVLGGLVAVCDPPLGGAISAAGAVVLFFSGEAEHVVEQSDVIDPETEGETGTDTGTGSSANSVVAHCR